jgi:hypothetical protein
VRQGGLRDLATVALAVRVAAILANDPGEVERMSEDQRIEIARLASASAARLREIADALDMTARALAS